MKSFQGEVVDELAVAPTGVVGDRRYALRDVSTGKVLSAKRHGVLLEASATTDADGGVTMTLPDGSTHAATEPGVDSLLSDWLGFPVTLAAADTAQGNGVYEFAFDIDDSPDAEWFDIDIPLGSFVDLAGAHLLTTASLEAIAAHHPEGDWDVRRFRPTALIDTDGADGFVEDAWVDRNRGAGHRDPAGRHAHDSLRDAEPRSAGPARPPAPGPGQGHVTDDRRAARFEPRRLLHDRLAGHRPGR